jgi:hypothetical protein
VLKSANRQMHQHATGARDNVKHAVKALFARIVYLHNISEQCQLKQSDLDALLK